MIHGLGSGVEAVVLDYVRATPGYQHHVAYSIDPTCHAMNWGDSVFAGQHVVEGSPRAFISQMRRVVAQVSPDVIHAHSSIAGVATRVATFGTPVVYTPHCFAFLRSDLSRLTRVMLWLAEALLSSRTRVLAACSPHEAALAGRFMGDRRITYVPNVAPPRPDRQALVEARSAASGPVHVVTSGRVSPQKDPATFAQIATTSIARGLDVRFTWIGSGPAHLEDPLRAAGVEVTGWLSREEAAARLGAGDLYLHSALWEAAPLTVLEAAEADLPILARRSAALRALGLRHLWSEPSEVVEALTAGRGSAVFEEMHSDARAVRGRHSLEEQHRQILGVYRDAIEGRSRPKRILSQ